MFVCQKCKLNISFAKNLLVFYRFLRYNSNYKMFFFDLKIFFNYSKKYLFLLLKS
ncbi:hypothetical protein PSOL_06070 [Candidatus Phytoplasma solani]